MTAECTYFDLNSYSSEPQDWHQWDFPAKLWEKVRYKSFSSLNLYENTGSSDSFTKEQVDTKSVEDVVIDDELDVSAIDVIKDFFSNSSRIPSSCPHKIKDDVVCPIHSSPEDGPSLSEWINTSNEYDMRGGNFCTVDLTEIQSFSGSSDEILLDFCFINYINADGGTIQTPISMCDAEIGELSAVRSKFKNIIYLKRTQFNSGLVANDAVFDGQVQASAASFSPDADVTLSRAKFRDRVCFNKAKILTEFDMWNAEFEGDAMFRGTTFGDQVRANWVDFRRYADFYNADFHSDLDLGGAFFHKSLGLSECNIDGSLYFDTDYDGCDAYGISVEAATNLNNLIVNGDFSAQRSSFSELVNFNNITIHGNTDLSNSKFGGVTTFNMATFKKDFIMTAAVFQKGSRFCHCRFNQEANFEMTEFNASTKLNDIVSNSPIKLNECTLKSGTIKQPEDEDTYFDLTRATLGDIDLKPQTKDVFNHYKIHKTEFNGFDFSHHMELYSNEYEIHTYECGQDTSYPTTAELVSTYLKSKNGANRVGATTAASRFFMKEMTFRRILHWDNCSCKRKTVVERTKSFILWISNWFLNISCGYGERPLRTIGVALFVILLYTPIYMFLNTSQNETLVSSISFSTQAFTALIFGQSSTPVPLSIQFIGATQGFVGAFLIALFVFALTRSIHR